MGFSLARVYIAEKTILMENFKCGFENDMDVNMATLFARGILWRWSFLSNLKPSYKKLDL